MVLIPAGSFLYRSTEDDKMARQDEKPQQVREVDVFYMDIYPASPDAFVVQILS